MSRIGNKPITVPSEVQVKIDGQKITVTDRKSTRLNSSHTDSSRMPSSA